MRHQYCLMCGMELTPVDRVYYYPNARYKKQINTFIPKSFCDDKCKHYFMKRVWADEMGVKLEE